MFRHARKALAIGAALAVAPAVALAADDDAAKAPGQSETFAMHAQSTLVWQANAAFRSPYQGANSLNPHAVGKETFDATLYVGSRLWKGGEVWINPEVDQGFGLSDTLGVAGFPSGEAYKVGKSAPYLKLPRLFLRQTIDLGGASQRVDADLNQLAGSQSADRLVLTVGKFSVADIFDANDYAHDPRHDFMNWTLIDEGTFDYASNAWGFTYGAVAELYAGLWVLRLGAFDLSDVPNSTRLDPTFAQNELTGEIEEDHRIGGQPGKLKLTAYVNRGRFGRYLDAVALARQTGQPADIAAVRAWRSRSGVDVNLQQQLAEGVGVFVKAGTAGGQVEADEFTDVDRTISGGLSLNGARWGRPGDTFAIAGVVNHISSAAQAFFGAGGLGILVGDGRLPHPGDERIVEAYYDVAALKALHVSFDFQFVDNPAYNRDRGPVPIGAVRLHAQF